MSVLVVRHGFSTVNGPENYGTLAFANPEAHLTERGESDAQRMGERLANEFGIVPEDTPAATSTLMRTQETALAAGFRNVRPYSQLDEVALNVSSAELKRIVSGEQDLPMAVYRAVERLLKRPPEQRIWMTHGLVIAGLCKVALEGMSQYERPVPRCCEIRELPIDTTTGSVFAALRAVPQAA